MRARTTELTRTKRLRGGRPLVSCLLLCAILVGATASGRAQTLAALARLGEESRSRSSAMPARTYTNLDLVPIPSITQPQPSLAPVPTINPTKATQVAKATGTAAEPARDEASWKGRMHRLRDQFSRDLTDRKAAERRVRQVSAYPIAAGDRLQSAIEAERLRAAAELSKLTAMVEYDVRAIRELEDEARRAGVPPGWLRP